ncbi:MAG: hypothetical protein RLZZ628_670 [Bacteroidota bacterium]|jgi:CHAT domain-containing protein/Flp pilus assembly protein TadD
MPLSEITKFLKGAVLNLLILSFKKWHLTNLEQMKSNLFYTILVIFISLCGIHCKKQKQLLPINTFVEDTIAAKEWHALGTQYKNDTTQSDSVRSYRALLYFQKALDIRYKYPELQEMRARSRYMIGLILQERKFQYRTALDTFTKIELKGLPNDLQGKILSAIGSVYDDWGDYDRAIEYYQKVISLQEASDGIDAFIKIGKSYDELKKYEEATFFYKKALDLNAEEDDRAMIYNNLGIIYREAHQLDSSLFFLKKALRISENSINPDMDGNIANKCIELAKTYQDLKQIQQAFQSIYRAIALLEKKDATTLWEAYTVAGDIAQTAKKHTEALQYYDKALHVLHVDKPMIDFAQMPLKKEWFSILYRKVLCFNDSNLKQYENALATSLQADSVAFQLRLELRGREARFFRSSTAKPLYEQGIKAATALWHENKDIRYWEMALHFSERTKATLLQESLTERQAKQFGGFPVEWLRREADLLSSIAVAKKKPDKALENLLTKWRSQLSELQDSMKQNKSYKQFFDANYVNRPPLKWENLHKNLSKDRLAIEYFWGIDSLYLFIWSAQQKPYYRAIASDSLLKQSFEQVRFGATQEDGFVAFQKAAVTLYEQLLKPDLESANIEVKRLGIVADDQLNLLPFDILTDRPLQNWADTKPYLVNRYAISMALHAEQLSEAPMHSTNESGFQWRGSSFLGVGIAYDTLDDFWKKHPEWGYLENSRAEIHRAATHFGSNQLLFDSTQHKKATAAVLMECAPQFDVIHLSTHGFANDNASGLVLMPDTLGNCIFEGDMLDGFHLKARLTVLSACHTGEGKLQTGEGILNLSRSFFEAGTSSVLMTLWQLSDGRVSDILNDFYINWTKKGLTKDTALQQAKLNYLKINQLSRLHLKPQHWAAMVCVGNVAADGYSGHWDYVGLWLFILISFITIFYFFLKRQK